jgi:haloalkane dehalogenase
VLEQLIDQLALEDVTVMVQDWGGPIGLGWAGRHPEKVHALVIGNTFAWPVNGDPRFERFSNLMGGPVGGFFIRYYDAFVNLLVPGGTARTLSDAELRAYRGPFPTHDAREPTHIFPREILGSRDYLEEVERNLPKLAALKVAIVWGAKDQAFQQTERERFEKLFPNHQTVVFPAAKHYLQEDEPKAIAAAIRQLLH